MNRLSEKELSGIQDLLSGEELLIKKFQMLAEHCEDAQMKEQLMNISNKHQGHFDLLYSQLQ